MSMRSNHPKAAEINHIAQILIDAWAKAEPDHGVTLHPVSYVATFADMARAVVEDQGRPRISHTGEGKVLVQHTADDLEALIYSQFDTDLRRRLLSALELIDSERAIKLKANLV